MAVRIAFLESNALVWAPSSVHPFFGCHQLSCRKPSEALLHNIGPQVHESSADSFDGEATGALPPKASMKGVFVIEALEGDRLDIPHEVVRWGRPYRFRHYLSGAYLSANLSAFSVSSSSSSCGATIVYRPRSSTSDACEKTSNKESDDSDNSEDEVEPNLARFDEGTALCFIPSQQSGNSDDRVRVDSAVGWLQLNRRDSFSSEDLTLTLCGTGEAVMARADRRACQLQSMIPAKKDPTCSPLQPWIPDVHHRKEIEANRSLGFIRDKNNCDVVQLEVKFGFSLFLPSQSKSNLPTFFKGRLSRTTSDWEIRNQWSSASTCIRSMVQYCFVDLDHLCSE